MFGSLPYGACVESIVIMTKEERFKNVLQWFAANAQSATTELHYDNPFQLLIAVILSAQCTDKRVNTITPPLFKAYPTPEVLLRLRLKKYMNTSNRVHIQTTRQKIW